MGERFPRGPEIFSIRKKTGKPGNQTVARKKRKKQDQEKQIFQKC